MKLQIKFQNRPRSLKAERFLHAKWNKLVEQAGRIDSASVECIRTAAGSNIVQLEVRAPKKFRTVVKAEHNQLFGALHQAVEKLKGSLLRIKGRMKDAERRRTRVMTPAWTEVDWEDAENVVKFEHGRQQSTVYRRVSEPPIKIEMGR